MKGNYRPAAASRDSQNLPFSLRLADARRITKVRWIYARKSPRHGQADCRQPPEALCESHIGDAEILGQLPHRLGPSELLESFARHGQRRFFVFVHSDLSRLVKPEPAFSFDP